MSPAAGNHATEANQNTVFVDTSLDTHLVMTVSDSDTVAEFKNRMMVEHHQCFPAIGDIKIEYLKVKRRGTFYRLSDSMLVKNAFAATKKNWFVSVDASRLEQDSGVQLLDKQKAQDQLTLPWVTGADSRLIDRHDYHEGRPSFVNQKVSNVNQLTSDDSCKDVSKKIEEERSSYDKQLIFEVQEKVQTANKDIKSKKRTRDVHNESLLVNDSGSGPYVKKKRKTKGVKSSGNASEENMVLTYDSNKAKDNEINDEKSSKQKSEGEDLSDEITRINNSENFCNLDQVAAAVSSGVKDVGKETHPRDTEASENVADVAMVVENNIQQETPFGISDETRARNTEASETVSDVEMVVENNIQQETHLRISGSGPSGKKKNKKKSKKKRVKQNVKASEENMVLTNDGDKVKDNEASINDKNSFEQKSDGKNLSAENTRINKGESCSILDQVATAVTSIVEDVGKETCPQNTVASETAVNVAMQETPFEISEKENDNEQVEKAVIDNEIPSSLTRTSDFEHDAPGPTSPRHRKGSKRSIKLKAAEKEVSSTSFSKELHNINKDAHDSSLQQDVGSTVQECAGDQSNNYKEDNIVLQKQGPQEKHYDRKTSIENLTERKRRATKSSVRKKDELLEKHGADDLVGNISSSTVAAPGFGESSIDERNEVSEKSLVDAKKGDDMIVKEVEISKSTENQKSQVHVENLKVKSRKESKRRKDGERSASINDEKQNNEAGRVTNEEIVLPLSETKQSPDIISKSGIGQVDAEKQNENMDGAKKKKRKSKKTSSAERNENESIRKHAANGDVSMPTTVSGPPLDGHLNDIANKEGESVTNEAKVVPQSETKQSLDILSKSRTGQVDAEKQNENMDDAKKKKRKSKKTSSTERNENESIGKHAANGDVSMPTIVSGPSLDGHLYDIANKEGESSLLDAEIKDGDKMKGEDKGKNNETVTVSEVSKIRMEGKDDFCNEPKDGSHEIDFMNYFAPASQPNMNAAVDTTQSGKQKKSKSKTKDSPLVQASPNTSIQSQKLISKPKTNSSKVSADVVKEPNMSQVKAPNEIAKIDAIKGDGGASEESSSSSESLGRSFHIQMNNKQQSVLGQTHVKTVVKSREDVVSSSQQVKSLLNTPGAIFGDDTSADDNESVDSDSSTRTPSRKSSSLSGESDSSIHSGRNGSHAMKRKEGGGKNSINTSSKLKNRSMAELFRSSSRFKKAKFSASQQMEDTESQPIDFVPDSQPVAKR